MRNDFKDNFGKYVNNSRTRRRNRLEQLPEEVIGFINCRPDESSSLVSWIYNKAKELDISLKMFSILANKQSRSKDGKKAFETGCLTLIRAMESYDLPRFIKNKTHLQLMISGKCFLKRGYPGFEAFANQKDVKYGGIVYVIKPIKPFCVHSRVLEDIYIGVTWKTLIERFIEHTEDAINAYIKENDLPNRLIERLILKAIAECLSTKSKIKSEISTLKSFIESKLLGKKKWRKKHEIKKLAEELFNSYFQMDVLEVHRNYETAWSREKWNIKNYVRKLKGAQVKGTLFPNGLNMVNPPEKPGHRSLPLYDIIFTISQGYIGPEINRMMAKCYNINVNYRNIYRQLNKFWIDWDNVLEVFFKPVVQKLLEYEDFQWKDIAISIRRAHSYRNKKNFKKWFFGLNVTQIRDVMKRGDFDWDNLEMIAKNFKSDLSNQNTVKGIPTEVWIKWFIKDIGMEEIARILGYKNVDSFRSAWIKQGRVSIFQEKFGTYSLAVKKYRKKRTIEVLTDEDFVGTLLDSRLYWIYINEFGFMSWKEYAVNRPSQGLRNCMSFFDTLFKEEELTIEILENLTARNYTKNQEIQKVIKKIIKT